MPATARTRRPKKKLSHLRKPQEMGLAEWQVALRRQFGSEHAFTLRNLGSAAVFSEFSVTNPRTQKSYRVAIRGSDLGRIIAVAPISPSTLSAPASTSNMCSLV